MSLDQNLFTLHVTPNPEDPNVVDLVDATGTVHYRKQKIPGNVYSIVVYDPLSKSLLASATAPSATSKHKTLQLHNPDTVVELKSTGTLSFRWSFKWEDHEFEWRREECFILRKPDPAVLVAVTKEPAGRSKPASVQLLDYNLTRFDIDDRKGLEIAILTALLTFHDLSDAAHAPRADDVPPPRRAAASASASTSAPATSLPAAASGVSGLLGLGSKHPPAARPSGSAPALPPKPAPRTGVERIAELHALRTAQGAGEANEVEVGGEGEVGAYAQYVAALLQDEAMLFVSVRAAAAADVPKVLRVVEETKRLRHKSGIAEDEELHQYVVYDSASDAARKGPRRINLDDPCAKAKGRSGAYAPPTSLLVHLSKIDMPELRPRVEVRDPGPELGWVVDDVDSGVGVGLGTDRRTEGGSEEIARGKDKDRDKEQKKTKPSASEKEREKAEKRAMKGQKRAEKEHNKAGSPPRTESNKPTKPSASPAQLHVPFHQPRPHQPSPPPAQLSNPVLHRSRVQGAPHTPPPYAPPAWSGAVHAAGYGVPSSTGRPRSPHAPAGTSLHMWPRQ
ncbi:hypothetical protein AcW1_006938 [Taiwanofungus camphoratus]|nr:hypothetical protein AcW1_006938 [Antrodia cinnamomea]